MLLSSWTTFDYLTVLTAFFAIIYAFYQYSFTYWKRRNVPFLKPSFPFGNLSNVITNPKSVGMQAADWYKQIKSKGLKYAGVYSFTVPSLIVTDPEVNKLILSKDFRHFTGHGFYVNEKTDPISANLFTFEGHQWRNMRVKLTPTFTSGKMKMMLPLVEVNSRQFLRRLEKVAKLGKVDVKEEAARFTTDNICSCAFGIESNCCEEDNSEIRDYGRDIFVPNFRRIVRFLFSRIFPNLALALNVRFVDKHINDFFLDLVEKNLKIRREKNIVRNDLFQLIMKVQEEALKNGEKFTFEDVAAEVTLFFAAGYETSATLTSFTLFELARNQDIQDKLRGEIRREIGNGEITYEKLFGLKYLGSILDETLRMYPSVPHLDRICTEDWPLPNGEGVLEKGTRVVIPSYGIQHDPEYFPNPEKYDPERFSPENKSNVKPYTYLPFGEGPRICLGMRFGLMQARMAVLSVIKNFRITLSEDMELPLIYNTNATLVLSTKQNLDLVFEKIAPEVN